MDLGSAGVIGSGLNFLSSAITNAQNRKFQQQENEKNRQFNQMMAEQQNRWNVENWQMNNDYNSPANQKRRLLEAGLNPDLMYTGNGVASTPMPNPSGSASSNGSISPNPAPQLDMSSLLLGAQKDLLEAQTRKTENEADVVESDAKYRDELNAGLVKFRDMQIRVLGLEGQLKEGEIKKIEPTLAQIRLYNEQISKNIDLLGSQRALTSAQALHQSIDNLTAHDRFKAELDRLNSEIRKNDASAHLSYSQAKELLYLLEAKRYNIAADTNLKVQQRELVIGQTSLTYTEDDNLQFQLDSDDKFKNIERGINVIRSLQQFLDDMISYQADLPFIGNVGFRKGK